VHKHTGAFIFPTIAGRVWRVCGSAMDMEAVVRGELCCAC